ncbi:CBO0543 family protein [Anaeroselena agilis]|uniref:CBO0543 family protein n=1 Tax=Anaeroselena agilis TaxID=3063788 RepID=A0ABU3NVD2_9FIRM|nr:CBO0543 family protein [Selenomonadales bacterium 4137-cl]
MDAFYHLVNATVISASISYYHWVTKELFSPGWLIITIVLAIVCVLSIVLIDKSRLREIILFGFLLAFLFGYTDVIATEYGLWEYKTRVIPVKSSVFPFSYTMNPIFHVFAYQYSGDWRSFAALNTIVAALFAFVAHPLFVWADALWLGNWNYINSFIYLAAVPLGVRAFVIWLADVEAKHAAGSGRTSLFTALNPAMKLLGDENDREK